jgi:adenosine deaminase
MSGVTLTDEYEKAADFLGFSWAELVQVARMGFEGAFGELDAKEASLARFQASVEAVES